MSAKSKSKLVRIVLASTVGSLLWAGCAQPRVAVSDPQIIAQAPIDLTNRRPDTHPELRTGLWQMTPEKATADVVLAPNIITPDALPGTADSAYLLGYHPEVINSVAPESQGEIIVEAAGAERPRRSLREQLFRRNPPSRIQRYERETIIEQEVETAPAPYRPSSENLKDDDSSGKLRTSFFVNQ